MRPSTRAAITAAVSAVALVGAALAIGSPAIAATGYTLPPTNGKFDYQLGGPYASASDVKVVSRDRTAAAEAGFYNVCYVNLMQTQEDDGSPASNPTYGTTAWWKKNHPSLLLKNASGTVIIDKDWNEALFDVRTAANRSALAAIQQPWIQKCKTDGFQAIEPDNIDAEARSKNLMTHQNVRDYLKIIVPYAHSVGLAIAQKNALSSDKGDEWATDGPRFVNTVSPAQGFDFAIAEECQPNKECADYTAMYGGRVYEIEYAKAQWTASCSTRGAQISVILRDLDVVPKGTKGYVYSEC